jgi:5-methylthioadenosine/S-adenosylhomocysteine deaminase
MLGPTSPLRCTPELLMEMKKLQDEFGVGIHTHLLESKVQAELSQKRYGKTMVEMIEDLGLISDKLFCAHTNWVTDRDVEILGSYGASVVHNIGSNLRGSAGISPIVKLMQAGCNIALGADGSSSNGSQNMFTLTRLALAAHRINQPDMNKWLTTRDIVKILTRGGARASMLDATSGSLEAGKQADVVLFDMNSPWFTPMNEPYHLLAWAENGSSVDTVLIDGNIVVEKSKVLTMDEEKVKQDARDMVEAIPIRNREIFRVIEEITPLLRVEHENRFKNR